MHAQTIRLFVFSISIIQIGLIKTADHQTKNNGNSRRFVSIETETWIKYNLSYFIKGTHSFNKIIDELTVGEKEELEKRPDKSRKNCKIVFGKNHSHSSFNIESIKTRRPVYLSDLPKEFPITVKNEDTGKNETVNTTHFKLIRNEEFEFCIRAELRKNNILKQREKKADTTPPSSNDEKTEKMPPHTILCLSFVTMQEMLDFKAYNVIQTDGNVRHVWKKVDDHYPPSYDVLKEVVATIDAYDKPDQIENPIIFVHCREGKGRSATVVAAYILSLLIKDGTGDSRSDKVVDGVIKFMKIEKKRDVVAPNEKQIKALISFYERYKKEYTEEQETEKKTLANVNKTIKPENNSTTVDSLKPTSTLPQPIPTYTTSNTTPTNGINTINREQEQNIQQTTLNTQTTTTTTQTTQPNSTNTTTVSHLPPTQSLISPAIPITIISETHVDSPTPLDRLPTPLIPLQEEPEQTQTEQSTPQTTHQAEQSPTPSPLTPPTTHTTATITFATQPAPVTTPTVSNTSPIQPPSTTQPEQPIAPIQPSPTTSIPTPPVVNTATSQTVPTGNEQIRTPTSSTPTKPLITDNNPKRHDGFFNSLFDWFRNRLWNTNKNVTVTKNTDTPNTPTKSWSLGSSIVALFRWLWFII